MIFKNHMRITGTNREIELITYGGGHTECDLCLFLNDEKISFVEDLASNGYHPLLLDGDPYKWKEIILKIIKMDIETVVPGHGPVGSVEVLSSTGDYLKDLIELVKITDSNSLELVSTLQKYIKWKLEGVFKKINFISE